MSLIGFGPPLESCFTNTATPAALHWSTMDCASLFGMGRAPGPLSPPTMIQSRSRSHSSRKTTLPSSGSMDRPIHGMPYFTLSASRRGTSRSASSWLTTLAIRPAWRGQPAKRASRCFSTIGSRLVTICTRRSLTARIAPHAVANHSRGTSLSKRSDIDWMNTRRGRPCSARKAAAVLLSLRSVVKADLIGRRGAPTPQMLSPARFDHASA